MLQVTSSRHDQQIQILYKILEIQLSRLIYSLPRKTNNFLCSKYVFTIKY
jgi:hypothetical protein